MILVKEAPLDEVGGKAYNLIKLNIKNTPSFYVCPASFFKDGSKEELKLEVDKLFDSKKKYAVRSSGIDEDSKEHSFAGVHESYLNVCKSDIVDRIYDVYKSAFKPQALAYRKNNNLSLENIKIAVLIQEMVEADFSGVINTINPISNNPDEIVISVTEGLGEKLVDGSVSGTTYIINGSNKTVHGLDILNNKLIKKILEMVYEIISKTDRFQDIEFAVKGNKVYFLQSRDITVYQNINPHDRTLTIDNSNIRESYYGFTSYLTYTFAKDVYRDVYSCTLGVGKVRKKIMDSLATSLENMLYYHEGNVYYNLNSWYHVTSIFSFKKSSSYMENMMGVGSSSSHIKKVKTNLLDILKLGVIFLSKLAKIQKLSDQFEAKFNQVVLPYYGKEINLTNDELKELYHQIESQIVADFSTPIINDCAVMIYYGLVTERYKKLNISTDVLNNALSNHGDVLSVGSAVELSKIIEFIKNDKELYDEFKNNDIDYLYNKFSDKDYKISEMISNYVYDFGPRVMDELKLETITMIEDKKLIYNILKEMIDVNNKHLSNNIEVEVPKGLRKLTNTAKKYIKNRERLRLKRTYIYSVVRNIFLCYGRNYHNLGLLDDPRDIFYLSKQEVLSGVGDFRKLVKERKEYELKYKDNKIHDRVVFYGEKYLPILSAKASGNLVGLPSGSGVVTAKVSLMNSINDKLEKGNIILTKRTDPGWIMLFPLASGLIVEHGSMLSHSFVVAREMGLPAVVNVAHATELIKDNDLVTLDGLKGEIKIEK